MDFYTIANHVRDYVDRAGDRKRLSATDTPMLKVLNVLEASGWTFDWVGPENCPDGYETLWEAMAGSYFGHGLKPRQRMEQALAHADDMEAGVKALKRRFLDSKATLEAPYIYVVPASITGPQLKVCVTVDPDHRPAAGTGETARNLELGNDTRLVKGQITSTRTRLTAMYGASEARRRLAEDIMPLISDMPNQAPEQRSLFGGFFSHN